MRSGKYCGMTRVFFKYTEEAYDVFRQIYRIVYMLISEAFGLSSSNLQVEVMVASTGQRHGLRTDAWNGISIPFKSGRERQYKLDLIV